jgi:hypothetical protein
MMKNALMGSVFLLALAAFSRAEASPLYTSTDLGSSYQLLAGAGGNDYGVTGPLGIIYAFDKAPVTHINIQSVSSESTSLQVLTLQDGNFQFGYATAEDRSHRRRHPGRIRPPRDTPSCDRNPDRPGGRRCHIHPCRSTSPSRSSDRSVA